MSDEETRLRQIIIDSQGAHGTCYWGLGFMFNPDTMKEDCKVCAAKRQMKSIANGTESKLNASLLATEGINERT